MSMDTHLEMCRNSDLASFLELFTLRGKLNLNVKSNYC
jgi:hypothetical protein